MTTGAYRDGILAADTQVSADGALSYVTKLFRARGGVIAISGDLYNAMQFVRWYGDHRKPRPDKDAGIECIVVDAQGVAIWNEALSRIHPLGDFCAVGTGQAAAMAAMHAGATALEAVQIASVYDRDTGGEVQTIELEPDNSRVVEFDPSARLKLATAGGRKD